MMEAVLEVLEHEHPVKLVDLQLHYEEKEEDDAANAKEEEGDDLITKEGFRGACDRCGEEINVYHRYYYKCVADSSCNFSLHKFCGELPTYLESTFHQHPLTMFMLRYNWSCCICKSMHNSGEMRYICFECEFWIDVNCAVEISKRIIHHPCHPHLLICVITKPVLCDCNACGKEHKGIFYQCSTTCTNFIIHSECAFLPKTLLIQHTTRDAFHHNHPLIISYSFPREDQKAKHDPKCRVCGHSFYDRENLWIYKCDRCMYYVHMDCATSCTGAGRTNKNYKDVDYPNLVHLPFPDETYSIPKHLFFQETRTSNHKVNDYLTHMSHKHPLALVNVDQTQSKSNGQTSSSNSLLLSIKCHDPIKKIQLLCNGCLRPIMSTMPFYRCTDQSCNRFALHEWCTRLPLERENHSAHPQHTLYLIYSKDLPFFFGVFRCAICDLPCNGFAYGCDQCKYYVDVACGLIPKQITHKAHPNHLLSIAPVEFTDTSCLICLKVKEGSKLSFYCNTCNIYIHSKCALLLTETIRHKYDKKHPMHLSYFPIENHKSEYFCEICEDDLNPHQSFYHCQHCVQSIHTACAPLILQSETHTYISDHRSVYKFVNIKFGFTLNLPDLHKHPLSFAQGIVSDGECSWWGCGLGLRYNMIFKCLKCNFAIHYGCCERKVDMKILVSYPHV
ncbi:hypothetical protein Lser_V15G38606 [Lactuca serriola]